MTTARALGHRFVGVVVLVAGSAALAAMVWLGQQALSRIDDRYGVRSPGVAMLLLAVIILGFAFQRRDAAGALTRHARRAGWRALDPDTLVWPWPEGPAMVRRAWSIEADGLPVIAGTVEWTGDAFAGLVDQPAGAGVFVVVPLARPVPPMALHLPFQRVGDSPLLDLPDLRWSYLNGTIPAWTARDRTLFTVTPAEESIKPAMIDKAVDRTLRIPGLLGLDRGVPPAGDDRDGTAERRVARARHWRGKAFLIPYAGMVVYLVLALVELLMIGLYAFRDTEPGGLLLALLCPALVLAFLVRPAWSRLAVLRHARRAGWERIRPGSREWPWTDLRQQGSIRVRAAWSFRSGGFPVTAGRISWDGNALADATPERDGSGVFVVLRLPEPIPSAAMRLPGRLVGDVGTADEVALRAAFRRGEIPPWTARGRELFVVTGDTGSVRPKTIDDAVRRTLHIARLLGCRPGDDRPPGEAR
ncbi:hypothetical protein Ait01nite_040600 [Actinoplanes italicus]|uniref:Uncharacterized protein n=1 Tax=Actinoplanes italicus TaxID=113567 RepID=A0A2T0K2Q5_9ACTN|nr:hypothetical protein [Actinoplanes italicus]PRX16853.1 hypothetical protein CLV67_118184 [Actinoplanes italicus]GIE31015.1 hypothetical protein Ait01nite_040600 [Actinoplanes italicus]